jgi:hypothetical protein
MPSRRKRSINVIPFALAVSQPDVVGDFFLVLQSTDGPIADRWARGIA